MKHCSICRKEKPLSEFGPKGRNKDGSLRLEARCKPCKNEQNRKSYAANRERIAKQRKAVREENRDEQNRKQREWYNKNASKHAARQRARYHADPEIREKQQARVVEYRKRDPKKWREYHRKKQAEWRANNPEKAQAHAILNRQVNAGKIVRPSDCEMCGSPGSIEAHHDDYSEPLQVIWVCKPCHTQITRLELLKNNAKKRRSDGAS